MPGEAGIPSSSVSTTTSNSQSTGNGVGQGYTTGMSKNIIIEPASAGIWFLILKKYLHSLNHESVIQVTKMLFNLHIVGSTAARNNEDGGGSALPVAIGGAVGGVAVLAILIVILIMAR